MSDLIMPIIIAEGLDIRFYKSKENAERSVEAIDVKNDEYVAYDGAGRLLVFEIYKKKAPGILGVGEVDIELVNLKEASDQINSSNELRSILLSFFGQSGKRDENLMSYSLEELIAKSVSECGYAN